MCEEVAMHAGFRWFSDLDFNSPVPDRTTLVKLRRHTWGEKVFRQVMEAIVGQCIEAGLVKGKAAVVDGSQVRARAAVTSLEAIEPVQSIEEYCNRLAQEDPPQAAAEQKPPDEDASNGGSGTARKAGDPDFHGERFSNRTHRSKTDPDARLFSKGDRVGAQLSYLVHDLMDLKSGVILDTTASRADGALEREAALALVDNVAKVHGSRVALRYLLMDANYTPAAFLADVLARGLEPVVPTKTLSKASIPGPLRKRVILVELARSHRRPDLSTAHSPAAASALRMLDSEQSSRCAASRRLISPARTCRRRMGQVGAVRGDSVARGRSIRTPLLRARSIPALTRSDRMPRSSWAWAIVM